MYSSLILIPFLGMIFLNLPLGAFAKKVAFGLAVVLLGVQMVVMLFPALYPWGHGLDAGGAFLGFNFEVDNLSRVVLFCIGMVLLCALGVQKGARGEEEKLFNFVNVVLLMLVGLNGIVLVRDIFSLYVFIEIAGVSSFILIGFNKDVDAFEAAFKYIILSVIATVLMLSAIALLFMSAGDTSFASIASALKTAPDKSLLLVAVGIFLCAAFIKGGVAPFHGWLPDAYAAAPSAVSVLLAGIVTKTVGVYTLIRIVNGVFGYSNAIGQILLLLGMLSAVFGALAALGQTDFKRMLAYSSISQVGYIVLGLGTGTPLGLAGAIFHLFNHATFKTLLFVNAAAVEASTGRRKLDQLCGLAKKMPVTGITSVLASLSCAGIPPLAGFWSKLMIIVALWLAGFYTYAVLAALASVLTLAYFLYLQRSVFWGKLQEDLISVKESGLSFVLPMLLLALVTVGVGVFFPVVVNVFLSPAMMISGG